SHLAGSARAGKRQAALDTREIEYGKAATALSQMVLGPVAAQLHRKRLLIVADGALLYVPFAALPVPAPVSSEPLAPGAKLASETLSPEHRNTMPVLAEHVIVNLPAASVLAILRQEAMTRKRAPKAVAVLADPVFSASDVRVNNGLTAQKRKD